MFTTKTIHAECIVDIIGTAASVGNIVIILAMIVVRLRLIRLSSSTDSEIFSVIIGFNIVSVVVF